MKTRLSTLLSLFIATALLVPGGVQPTVAQSQAESAPSPASAPDHAQVAAVLQSSPVMFIENVGQFAEGARFQVRGGDRTIWLADNALWITLLEPSDPELQEDDAQGFPLSPATRHQSPRKGVNIKLSFVGANPAPRLEPFDRLDTHVSYFIGSDSTRWRPDVPVWGGVRLLGLYPGIDLELTGEDGLWQPLIVAYSGADLNAVRLRVEGADILSLEDGRARLATAVGELTLPLFKLVSAQGTVLPPPVRPSLSGAEILAPFTSALSLKTDTPIQNARSEIQDDPNGLLYSTFLGGSDWDSGNEIVVDGAGNAYIAGLTSSANFPTTPGGFDISHNGDFDVFVVELNPAGSELEYGTFLGGNGVDYGDGLVVDGSGTVYVTGITYSANFPTTTGAFDTSHNGSGDVFIAKLNPAGSELVYSTFVGGSSDESADSLTVDDQGSAYVTGETLSTDFPTTPGALDTKHDGFSDAFVAKALPKHYFSILGAFWCGSMV